MNALTVGSLFSGIGGLELGLERAGMTVKWQAEVDPYCSRVLAKHWPAVPNLGDVTTIEWGQVERVDLVCGGFPCQPWSVAGRRLGTADDRWLWPEFVRCLRGLRPDYVLVENVPGLLVGGMGHVLGDLAELGFDAEWDSIPAAAVGAPHLRYRVFVVAHADRDREPGVPVDAFTRPGIMVSDAGGAELREQPVAIGRRGSTSFARDDGAARSVANPDCSGLAIFQGSAAQSELARWGAAGRRDWWGSEPDVGRVAHGIPHRVDRLRALGNAVVPQVAEWVGRRILAVAS